MVLTIADAVKAELERSGSEIIWKADFYLGPFAYLRVANAAVGAGDSFTLDVTHAGGTISKTYVATTHFTVAATETETAANMAAAINNDTDVNDRVSAFNFQPMLVVKGGAYSTRAQASPEATEIALSSSDVAAWYAQFEPLAYTYTFVSSHSSLVTTDVAAIPEIARIENVSAEIDVRTREFSIGSVEITLEDANGQSVAREIFKRCFPRGRLVKLYFGTPDTELGDFVPAGGFIISDVIPQQGSIVVECEEIPSLLARAKYDNRNSPTPILWFKDFTPGTGVTISVEVTWSGGAAGYTFTEGTHWDGHASSSSDARLSLADAVHGTAVLNTRVAAELGGTETTNELPYLYLLPIGGIASSPVGIEGRAIRITARSSDTDVIQVIDGFSLVPDVVRRPPGFYEGVFYPDPVLVPGIGDTIGPPSPGWTNIHPISALRDLYRAAGVQDHFIDEASFARANYSTISHWGISAHGKHYVSASLGLSNWLTETDGPSQAGRLASDIQSELCALVQGGPIVTEEGKIKFVRRDVSASPIRVLTDDDFTEFEVQEQYRNEINAVVIQGTAYGDDNDSRVWMLSATEPGAITLNSFRASSNPDEETIKSPLLGTFTQLSGFHPVAGTTFPGIDNTDTVIWVAGAWRAGVSGTRQQMTSDATLTQVAGDNIVAGTRDVWLLLWEPRSGATEIVKATGISNDGVPRSYLKVDLPPGDTRYRLEPRNVDPVFNESQRQPLHVQDDWKFNVERAQLNSQSQTFITVEETGDRTFVCDITIAKAMADHTLTFAFGVPIVSFKTSLKHYDLQLNDVITFEWPTYLNTFADGAGSSLVFEIIAKELDFPWVRFTAALLRTEFSRQDTFVHYTPTPDVATVYPVIETDGYVITNDGDYALTNDGARILAG